MFDKLEIKTEGHRQLELSSSKPVNVECYKEIIYVTETLLCDLCLMFTFTCYLCILAFFSKDARRTLSCTVE